MPAYVAFLRGIGPGNPNMRNEKLRELFEFFGFENVRTVISSGNVLFESPARSKRTLEARIEKALPEHLGFSSTTIIRSLDDLQKLVAQNPFPDMTHSPKTYLNVTFLKNPSSTTWQFPYQGKDKKYTVLGMYGDAICSVVDATSAKTPDLMLHLEKEFGKQITTRTWNTIQKVLVILKKRKPTLLIT